MPDDFATVFAALKPALRKYKPRLAVKTDTATEYTLVTKAPSPFPQHKGQPMFFGSVKLGKAYVSVHLLPLYMSKMPVPALLKKRMQRKACFNFKTVPDKKLLAELEDLTGAGLKVWAERGWL